MADLLTWDPNDGEGSLTACYVRAINRANLRIEWYQKCRIPKKNISQLIRVFAILVASMGALSPLIDSTGYIKGSEFGKAGYVLIAAAVALLQFDHYFGFSTGWIRYMSALLSLEKSKEEFEFDWVILKAQSASFLVRLQRIKDFSLQVEGLVKQETDAWVAEFQSSIAELERSLKSEAEARKPGSIKIIVSNATDFDLVDILVNDHKNASLAGVTEGLIPSTPPGRYVVTAVGKKAANSSRVSKIVEVQANAMATTEMAVPAIPV